MNDILAIIRRKPPIFLAVNILYLAAVCLIKWHVRLPGAAVMFLTGGLLGVYFLDIAEAFFRVNPSPFRSIVFFALFAIVSFFLVTSSATMLATGLVLSLFLSMLLWQYGEWNSVGNLDRWYRTVAGPVPGNVQYWILVSSFVFFLLLSVMFVRS